MTSRPDHDQTESNSSQSLLVHFESSDQEAGTVHVTVLLNADPRDRKQILQFGSRRWIKEVVLLSGGRILFLKVVRASKPIRCATQEPLQQNWRSQ